MIGALRTNEDVRREIYTQEKYYLRHSYLKNVLVFSQNDKYYFITKLHQEKQKSSDRKRKQFYHNYCKYRATVR